MKEPLPLTYKVQLRGGFSDRNGINVVSTTMQVTDFEKRTRTYIANFLNTVFDKIEGACQDEYGEGTIDWTDLHLDVLRNVYTIECYDSEYRNDVELQQQFEKCAKYTIYHDSYDSILTVLEYIFNYTSSNYCDRGRSSMWKEYQPFDEKEALNNLFEQEYVGYRFVGDSIVPIVDDCELQTINKSLSCQFDGCKSHISKAVSFLSDRTKPDYKNCIKESISAVESICGVIVKDSNAVLSSALKQLEKDGVVIHSALKQGFEKLYGYTSDQGGIRHAEGMFESNVTFEEAKYMLVSCCAFVNYLIAIYGKTL